MCLPSGTTAPKSKSFWKPERGTRGNRAKKASGISDACTKGFQDKMLAKSVRIHGAMSVRPQ